MQELAIKPKRRGYVLRDLKRIAGVRRKLAYGLVSDRKTRSELNTNPDFHRMFSMKNQHSRNALNRVKDLDIKQGSSDQHRWNYSINNFEYLDLTDDVNNAVFAKIILSEQEAETRASWYGLGIGQDGRTIIPGFPFLGYDDVINMRVLDNVVAKFCIKNGYKPLGIYIPMILSFDTYEPQNSEKNFEKIGTLSEHIVVSYITGKPGAQEGVMGAVMLNLATGKVVTKIREHKYSVTY